MMIHKRFFHIIFLIVVFLLPSQILFAQNQKDEYPANYARAPRFKALLYYSEHVEEAHVQFAKQAEQFFRKLTYGEGFILETTHDLSKYSDKELQSFDVQIWLNNVPSSPKEREAFMRYMENGGGWVGFHGAAYNDRRTQWPWFVNFLGGGVFLCNNWPPQPVLVTVEKKKHPVTRSLPKLYVMPSSEWYMWKPSPRKNQDVDVLLSISLKNYPLGIKDVVRFGDFPVVWTNRNYRMIYLNSGHGDESFTDATQNLMIINAFRWIVSRSPKGNPFDK